MFLLVSLQLIPPYVPLLLPAIWLSSASEHQETEFAVYLCSPNPVTSYMVKCRDLGRIPVYYSQLLARYLDLFIYFLNIFNIFPGFLATP